MRTDHPDHIILDNIFHIYKFAISAVLTILLSFCPSLNRLPAAFLLARSSGEFLIFFSLLQDSI